MAKNKEKILVIKLGALGDFIQALGAMAAIRKHHANAEITLLTTEPFKEFAKASNYFDYIWIDKRPKFFNIKGWLDLRKRLNEAHFDRVYDLQNNDRTCLYFKLFKNKNKPEWVGIAKNASHRNLSLDRTAGLAFDGHVQTLKLAGIENIEIDKLEWVKADISNFVLEKPYALLIPGSAPMHPEKRWPSSYFATIATMLDNAGYQPIILGTAIEKNIAKEIIEICPRAIDFTEQTSLAQIIVLARGADVAIGNDTGPMHLIASTGCPSILLFSKHSNPNRHAPKGKHVTIIQEDNLENLNPEKIIIHIK